MPLRLGATFCLLIACSVAPAAVQLVLDLRSIDEAILLGHSRVEAERRRFHQPYRITVGQPPVDYIDAVTPFRRVVLAAEARAAAGDRGFGQRQALELLDAVPQQIDMYVELTFHPLNTYIGVPGYEVMLMSAAGTRVEPRTIARFPRYGARLEGLTPASPMPAGPILPGGSQPMLGGTILAGFDGRLLEPAGVYSVVVIDDRKELARGRIDLGKLR